MQKYGLKCLHRGALTMSHTLRAPLCAIALLGWHLHASFLVDNGDCDMLLVQRLLNHLLTVFPNVRP
jgi:hypothetical protein